MIDSRILKTLWFGFRHCKSLTSGFLTEVVPDQKIAASSLHQLDS